MTCRGRGLTLCRSHCFSRLANSLSSLKASAASRKALHFPCNACAPLHRQPQIQAEASELKRVMRDLRPGACRPQARKSQGGTCGHVGNCARTAASSVMMTPSRALVLRTYSTRDAMLGASSSPISLLRLWTSPACFCASCSASCTHRQGLWELLHCTHTPPGWHGPPPDNLTGLLWRLGSQNIQHASLTSALSA